MRHELAPDVVDDGGARAEDDMRQRGALMMKMRGGQRQKRSNDEDGERPDGDKRRHRQKRVIGACL